MRTKTIGMLALAIAVSAAGAGTAAAQSVAGARAALAAVDQVFEGMRTADAAMVRAVFAEDARFTVLDTQGGSASVQVRHVDGWIAAIGTSSGRWDERIYDVEVQVDGPMASVWAPYTFYLDGSISHCGINSIELLRDAGGWKVTQISDTRRREGCPDPRGG